MRTSPRLFGVLVVLSLSSACGGGGNSPTSPATPSDPYNTPGGTTGGTTTQPGTNEVIANTSNAFTPSSLSVSKGTTVTFTFQGVTHNVTFAAVTGAPSNIGETYSTSVQRVFSTAGTFGYNCTLHPGMSGSVVVQ